MPASEEDYQCKGSVNAAGRNIRSEISYVNEAVLLSSVNQLLGDDILVTRDVDDGDVGSSSSHGWKFRCWSCGRKLRRRRVKSAISSYDLLTTKFSYLGRHIASKYCSY